MFSLFLAPEPEPAWILFPVPLSEIGGVRAVAGGEHFIYKPYRERKNISNIIIWDQ